MAKPGAAGTLPEPVKAKAEPHIAEQRHRPQSLPGAIAQPAKTTETGNAGTGQTEVGKTKAGQSGAGQGGLGQGGAGRSGAGQGGAGQSGLGQTEADQAGKIEADQAGKSKPEGSLARLASYRAEVEELLGGDSAARRRGKNTTASGLPAPDPATQEPQIKLTRPPRKSGNRQKD